MRPKSNKEQAKKLGNGFEKGIKFVDISINLLKLFTSSIALLAGPNSPDVKNM